MILISSSLLKN